MAAMSVAAAPERDETGPVPAGPPLQFLRFVVGGEHHAVRIDQVREILELAPTTPLPLMPPFVRGVMNLRGAVVPVIDLAARLDLPPTVPGRRTCVVIVDVGPAEQRRQTLGMLVDAVHEVVDASPAELEPVPRLGSRIDPAFIRQMVRVRDAVTPELALEVLLDPQALGALIQQHLSH